MKFLLCRISLEIFFVFNLSVGVMSALKTLQDRLKQVEREKKEAEQHLNKLAASTTATAAASYSQSAGK